MVKATVTFSDVTVLVSGTPNEPHVIMADASNINDQFDEWLVEVGTDPIADIAETVANAYVDNHRGGVEKWRKPEIEDYVYDELTNQLDW